MKARKNDRVLEQYRDLFDAAPDGVVLLSHAGEMQFVNPAARAITGQREDELLGRPLADLVHEDDRELLREILRGGGDAGASRFLELRIASTSAEYRVLSVSVCMPPGRSGTLVLSFRDVTAERNLTDELQHTKEFFERLINSTVDAMVACDLDGQITLFNRVAQRIFGRPPERVIGETTIKQLFPAGLLEQVRGQLVNHDIGGAGRLERVRAEIVGADGAQIPVLVSASALHDRKTRVGTVFVITDLRERLLMEQQLAHAQEKLLETEKQALIAELAGTTAHELNQPLTSVMGYAELLQRRLQPEDENYRAAARIVQEAQRMADIVRKIGRITRYETKTYVGETQILDLDKASS